MDDRILFASNYVDGLREAWEHWGYRVYEAKNDLEGLSLDELLVQIKNWKDETGISACFSINFHPNLAEACHEQKIDYINWGWDCPQAALWHKAAKYNTNYTFVFDYKQYTRLLGRGLDNVYYLTISPDIDTFDRCISQDAGSSEERWSADVAFVGNLYNDADHRLYDEIVYLPPYLKGYLEALMTVQSKMWGIDLISEAISEHVMGLMKQYVGWDLNNKYDDGVYEVLVENMIGQKMAQMERKEVCTYLADHYDFRLYTRSDTSFNPNINNCGSVDYMTKMPLVFRYSKINIHIQSRSIPSGMSLRILDVLACEGFLLTNYQPEIEEYFTDGEELVIYYDFQDMYEKIEYYLEHEEERKRIAHAGYQKVKEEFSYVSGVKKILNIWKG